MAATKTQPKIRHVSLIEKSFKIEVGCGGIAWVLVVGCQRSVDANSTTEDRVQVFDPAGMEQEKSALSGDLL